MTAIDKMRRNVELQDKKQTRRTKQRVDENLKVERQRSKLTKERIEIGGR